MLLLLAVLAAGCVTAGKADNCPFATTVKKPGSLDSKYMFTLPQLSELSDTHWGLLVDRESFFFLSQMQTKIFYL